VARSAAGARYLDRTRLRLRAMSADSGTVFKLAKKYGDREGPAESITNLYVTATEHALLERLPGASIAKHRFLLEAGSVDEYGAPPGLAVYSIEFDSLEAAAAFTPPAFAGREVTFDDSYSGFALATGATVLRDG
jgi:CYTH domain-containing protein